MKILKWIGSKIWKLVKLLFKFLVGCMGFMFVMYFINRNSKSEETEVEYEGFTYKIPKGSIFDKDLAFKGDYYDDKEFVEILKMEEES